MVERSEPAMRKLNRVVGWMELRIHVRNVRDGEFFIFWSAFRPQHTGIPRADGILCGTDGNEGDQLQRASHSRSF